MSEKSYSPGAQRIRRLLHELFRGSDWRTILAAVGFLALMQWAATDIHDLLHGLAHASIPDKEDVVTGGISASLLLFYIWILRRVASHAPGGKLDIREETSAERCKGLIVFLSLMTNREGDSAAVVDSVGKGAGKQSLESKSEREKLKGPWRMPVEAIAHHADWVECVVVIFSSSAQKVVGDGAVDASPYDRFRRMMERLTDGKEKPLKLRGINVDQGGINFNVPGQVLGAVNDAKTILQEEYKCRPEQIIVDITSGTKIASAIAGAAAFDDKVRFQYVDCVDGVYRTAAYDLSYIPYGK